VLARDSYRLRAQALQAEIAASDPLGTISAMLARLCAANDRVFRDRAGSSAQPRPSSKN
jgi:hypothetical protein